jgi:hypothetical protein
VAKVSDLLPYDAATKSGGDLKKGLHELLLILHKLRLAVERFMEGQFECFDSLVGENGCHIRAVKVALLANSSLELARLKGEVVGKMERIEALLEEKVMRGLSHQKISLKALMETEMLDVQLSGEEFFLLKAYLLTEVKENLNEGEILRSLVGVSKSSPDQLISEHPHISMKFVKKLTDRLRTMLSESSVSFIREIAECQEVQRMVSDEFSYKHNTNLTCTPLFWTIQALLQKAHKEGIAIVLHVKYVREMEKEEYQVNGDEYLFFRPEESARLYGLGELSGEDLDKPACVVEGVVLNQGPKEWRESVSDLSLLDIILANCAAHRQYPDPERDKEILRIQDPNYERYRQLADLRGFSLNNPSSFLIRHIYPSQPKRFFATV